MRYTPTLALWILGINFHLVILRGWMAFSAYSQSTNDPDPEVALWWVRRVRLVSIAQTVNWWVLSTLMMLHFGTSDNGYFVLPAPSDGRWQHPRSSPRIWFPLPGDGHLQIQYHC